MNVWVKRTILAGSGFVSAALIAFVLLWLTAPPATIALPAIKISLPEDGLRSSVAEGARRSRFDRESAKKIKSTKDKVDARSASGTSGRLEREPAGASPQGPVSLRPLLNDEAEVHIATTLAKTGEAALLGKALSDGLFLYLNRINSADGGIGGVIQVMLDQRDDESRLRTGAKHILKLKRTIPLFFSPLSDGLLEKVLVPLLDKDEAACLFPVAGIRPRPLPENLVYFRASYVDELHALVHYTRNVLKKQRIALFYEDSSWGRTAKAALTQILKFYKLKLLTSASYQSGTVNVMPALKKMAAAEPQVVICVANGRPAYNFIREAVNDKLHYVQFLGISRLAGIQEHLLASRGITLTTSSVVPNPRTSSLPIVKQYRADMQHYLPNKGLSTYGLEGYICSALVSDALTKLPANATVGTLLGSFEKLRGVNFQGMPLSYYKGGLSHSVWMNDGPDTEWRHYQLPAGGA